MPVRVSCPFCNTGFDLPAVPPTHRTPCPRCGESVPVKGTVEEPGPTPSANGEPRPRAAATAPPPKSLGGLAVVSLGLTAVILAAFGFWFLTRVPPSNATATSTKPAAPPATKPPAILAGLRYLPRDTQVVLAVQPSPLVQYAERTNQTPTRLFETLGLPKALFDGLADAGFPPQAIDQVVIGANAADLWFVAVLVARSPVDDTRLREKLKAKVNADKRDRLTGELGGLPVHLTKADDRTVLFAWREADLAAAAKPTAGLADFRPGLRESVDRLSPASVAWLATDSTDWATVAGLTLAARFAGQPELPKRLGGVRAAAAGLFFEPELRLRVQVRMADAGRAKELSETLSNRLADAKGAVTTTGEWADADVPFDPPRNALGLMRKAD